MNRLLAPSNHLFIGDKDKTRVWRGGRGSSAHACVSVIMVCARAAPKECML